MHVWREMTLKYILVDYKYLSVHSWHINLYLKDNQYYYKITYKDVLMYLSVWKHYNQFNLMYSSNNIISKY